MNRRVEIGVAAGLLLAPLLALSAVAAPDLPLLTSLKSVRELAPDEAKRGYPVRIEAVVTYFDPAHDDLFLQDQTAGLWIDRSGQALHLQHGTRVEVQGVTG